LLFGEGHGQFGHSLDLHVAVLELPLALPMMTNNMDASISRRLHPLGELSAAEIDDLTPF
jgi:hypothetical protein